MKYCTRATQKKRHVTLYVSIDNKQNRATAVTVAESEDNMTESEAIEKLRAYHKCQRLQVKGIYEDCNEKLCDNCDLCYMQGTTGEHMTAIGIAIQALEKQIPKKPIKSENQVVRYVNTYYCPTCELGITGTNIAKWCYHCGQKLDWSDEE